MKDLQRALLEAVGDRVTACGFERKPVGQSFLRRMPGGRHSLHLAFINHAASFDIVADVAVRFDALEDLVNATSQLLSQKEKAQTYSLGAELGNISGEDQKRWSVSSQADIDPVTEQILLNFKVIGVPYLDKASTPEGALALLTSPGPQAWLHSPIHASRAKRVVGLAHILGRSHEAATLAQANLRQLEEMHDPGLPDFKKFVSGLGIKI